MGGSPALPLAVLWVGAVLVGAWRWRPPAGRLAAFIQAEHTAIRPLLVTRLGSLLRRAAGRPVDPTRDRRAGFAVIATVLVFVLSPVAALAGLGLWLVSGALAERRREHDAEQAVLAAVPEAIDLFALAAGAGHPVQRSLHLVASRAGGPVGEALRAAVRRIELGERTADALDQVTAHLGEPVRPLVGVLCASERYGTALVPALERLAGEARTDRRRRAEEEARRVPVKLLFPLVLCTLPAFALLTVVPLLVGAFGSLRL